jgi:hypothetical protein
MKPMLKHLTAVAASLLAAAALPAAACTRVVFLGDDGTVVTGRSMDWKEDMHSNLWMFPRGIARDGRSGPNSIKWTSKYGSVAVAGYEVGTTDGMNEKGLVGNLLYLAESNFGKGTRPDKPYLSISLWMQYALDNFVTVSEAVAALEKEPFQILAPKIPNGAESTLHLSLSDASGDSAILQYVGGKLVIYHGRQYQVMTNSPTFDQQLAINTYWDGIGGLKFLPVPIAPPTVSCALLSSSSLFRPPSRTASSVRCRTTASSTRRFPAHSASSEPSASRSALPRPANPTSPLLYGEPSPTSATRSIFSTAPPAPIPSGSISPTLISVPASRSAASR